MNGRDRHGMLASASSVAKLPYQEAQDGISLTATVVPSGLGRNSDEQVANLVGLLDAYMVEQGFHINVNVLNREMLDVKWGLTDVYRRTTRRALQPTLDFGRRSTPSPRPGVDRPRSRPVRRAGPDGVLGAARP